MVGGEEAVPSTHRLLSSSGLVMDRPVASPSHHRRKETDTGDSGEGETPGYRGRLHL